MAFEKGVGLAVEKSTVERQGSFGLEVNAFEAVVELFALQMQD